jgi:phospholipid/cholesterol/gamma-HCH transport system ATP-binding protein
MTATSDILVRGEGLTKRFGARNVLEDVSLEVRRGETLVVMGSSGHGKSTLLRLLTGLERPDAGRVLLFGDDFFALPPRRRDEVRQRFGILFQSGALYSSMTVGENVATPIREHRRFDEDTILTIVKMKLELVGLRDARDLMPAQLSGGMRKRVGLARAIALDPEVLFCDEPTSGLDPVATAAIDEVVRAVSRTLGVATIVVTHDMTSAFRIADRIVMLFRGRVVAAGTPEEIRDAEDPAVRQFVRGLTEGPIPLRFSRRDYAADLLEEDT